MVSKVNLARLFFSQHGLCHWCRQPMHLDDDGGSRAATRDHLIPKSQGGGNFVWEKGNRKARNIVAACRGCNSKRGNMDAEEFRKALRNE